MKSDTQLLLELAKNERALSAERDALRARVAELEGVIGCLVPPMFHKSVPDSWDIYTAFAAGGQLHSYTVDQAKRAQSVLARHPAQSLAAIKAAALKELKPLVETIGNEGDQAIYWSEIEAESERLEKEAEHG